MRDQFPEESPDFVLHPRVWTWGYHGRSVALLEKLLDEKKAIVFDARLKPFSRFDKQWNKAALQARLGHRYLHIPEWGNRNYKNEIAPKGVSVIADYQTGLTRLRKQLQQTAVVVICVCKHYETCHRTTIAQMLRKDGIWVEEYQAQKSLLLEMAA